MSLNKLKDALQDYQNSYSECLGITPTSSTPTQRRAEKNSALPQPDFKIEIPDPLEINSTQVTQKKSLLHRRKLRKTFLNKSTILSPNMVKMINHTQISRIKIFSVDLVLV